MNRNNQPFRAGAPHTAPESAAKDTTTKKKKIGGHDFTKLASVVLLICSALVVLGAIILLTRPESDGLDFVDKNAYQAVDVLSGGSNGDQVYFGKIAKVTKNQIVLTNVFYPIANKDSSSVTTLVPFVCSLATPTDQLVLNKSQITYWYNLQSGSKVSKTIDDYKKNNNGKANCDNLNTNTSANSSSQNAGDTSTTPTNNETKTNNTTTKP